MPYNSLKMTHTDGTMHHLGINESHVAKKVILVPNPEDVPILAKELENADFMGDYREYVPYTGGSHAREQLEEMGLRRSISTEVIPHIRI